MQMLTGWSLPKLIGSNSMKRIDSSSPTLIDLRSLKLIGSNLPTQIGSHSMKRIDSSSLTRIGLSLPMQTDLSLLRLTG